ncbi:MAG TPA: hypothetical protein VLW54_11030 [Candidatus Acidoferrales bacterium]|nr:hypothetical protein [Candidatus Acidoferrales bacterium]
MKSICRCLATASLVFTFTSLAAAQEARPPHILQITREFTKPGKAGAAHDKTESLFVQAMARAKWPTHYLGMTSLSGKMRALFLTEYDSFSAWEKDNQAIAKNASLSAALEHASVVDGELLDSMDQGVFVFREDLSLRPMADISHMRYLEVSGYHVRPGHMAEWTELVKMVKAAYESGVPGSHWGMYELAFGGDGGTFLVLIAHKSLAEFDKRPETDKQFAAAMGAEGMKKFTELIAASVDSSQHQIFSFNPHMSYVEDSWIKAEPDFWKPKAAPAAKPAAAEKKSKQ